MTTRTYSAPNRLLFVLTGYVVLPQRTVLGSGSGIILHRPSYRDQ